MGRGWLAAACLLVLAACEKPVTLDGETLESPDGQLVLTAGLLPGGSPAYRLDCVDRIPCDFLSIYCRIKNLFQQIYRVVDGSALESIRQEGALKVFDVIRGHFPELQLSEFCPAFIDYLTTYSIY